MSKRNIDFHESVKIAQGERQKRMLKLDIELEKLQEEGLDLTLTTLMEALNDTSITNYMISSTLKDELDISVSESAVRRWRIENAKRQG
jgi:hypothetical protein